MDREKLKKVKALFLDMDGVLWTARSMNDDPIEEGVTVVVREIQGVKVLVEPEPEE